MAFSAKEEELAHKWDKIPTDVDVLITHNPPFNLLDLAFQKRDPSKDRPIKEKCQHCNHKHPNYRHWGSKSLLKKVKELSNRCYLALP